MEKQRIGINIRSGSYSLDPPMLNAANLTNACDELLLPHMCPCVPDRTRNHLVGKLWYGPTCQRALFAIWSVRLASG
jgi:hypothetical protein